MENKQSVLKPLLAYAGKRKVLTYLSLVRAGMEYLI